MIPRARPSYHWADLRAAWHACLDAVEQFESAWRPTLTSITPLFSHTAVAPSIHACVPSRNLVAR